MTDLRPCLPYLTAALALAMTGCISGPELTKEQARAQGGLTSSGDDVCELYGWYDDGVCDDFCPEIDSDCGVCLAFPSCDAAESQHATESDCPADASCRAVTLCGQTIWCSDTGVTCDGLPSCGPDETEHATESDCPADASCRAVSECGATIWCSDTAVCAAYPSCGSGETAHASSSDCPADGACRAETLCGETIWCSWDEAVMCAGVNPEGCLSSGCAEGFHCDTTIGSAPSACICSPEYGAWDCTPDLNGGVCVEGA